MLAPIVFNVGAFRAGSFYQQANIRLGDDVETSRNQ
jgi:hypothetical protein